MILYLKLVSFKNYLKHNKYIKILSEINRNERFYRSLIITYSSPIEIPIIILPTSPMYFKLEILIIKLNILNIL